MNSPHSEFRRVVALTGFAVIVLLLVSGVQAKGDPGGVGGTVGSKAVQLICPVLGCAQALLPASETSDPYDDDRTNIRTALKQASPGGVVELCPGKEYLLSDQIDFAADMYNVTLKTCTSGSLMARAVLKVVDRTAANGRRATALRIRQPNVTLDYLEIDGGGPWPGKPADNNNLAADRRSELIDAGGATGSNLVVRDCILREPMGWSALRLYPDGCAGALIEDNQFIDLGRYQWVNGVAIWADGISIGCAGTVTGNVITNPSDGGIVVFQPNVVITQNTIEVTGFGRHSFGGINLVDCHSAGDMTGIEVRKNDIKATNGGTIDIAIGVGPSVWWCPGADCPTLYPDYNMTGSVLSNNRITNSSGGSLKYGIAVARVRGLETYGNYYVPAFAGAPASCSGTVPPPNRGAAVASEDLSRNTLREGVGFWDPSYPRSRFWHLIGSP